MIRPSLQGYTNCLALDDILYYKQYMSSSYETIKTDTNDGMRLRTLIIFIFIAFIGGIIAAGWAITKYDLFQSKPNNISADKADDIITLNPETIAAPSTSRQPITNGDTHQVNNSNEADTIIQRQNNNVNDQLINERVDSLDNRLAQIDSQAQQVSGNADRTEAMLIAFAARRAIDSGSTLGYIKDQLQARFISSNGDDVKVIIEAGDNPVRLSALQNQLENNAEFLLKTNDDKSTWDIIKKEISELIVIRSTNSQPLQAEQRLAQIKTALSNRDVKSAITEMEQMPGAANAQEWITYARRYIKVQEALDAIEKTAILLPNGAAPLNPRAPQTRLPLPN